MATNTLPEKKTALIKAARLLALAWVVLSITDAVITYICLRDPANIEGNPFANALLSEGEALFYGIKFLVTVGIGTGFWWLSGRTSHLKPMIACQALLIMTFAGVLGNNLLHL